MQLILNVEKTTAQTYFQKKFQNAKLEWKDIYASPRRVTINTNLHIFEYKLLQNVLYLNDMFYKFGKRISPLCSFCMEVPESPIHLFHSCIKQTFFGRSYNILQDALIIPPITPQSIIFRFTNHKVNYHLINHILLTFKYYICKTRENGSLDLKLLKRNIHKIKNIKKQISLNKPEKRKSFEQKWKLLLENITYTLKYMVVQQLG